MSIPYYFTDGISICFYYERIKKSAFHEHQKRPGRAAYYPDKTGNILGYFSAPYDRDRAMQNMGKR